MAGQKGHGNKSRRREIAIAALLSEPDVPAAARIAGVSEHTLRDWLATPEFREEFAEARRRVLEGAITQLASASVQAVAALVRNLACGTAAVEVRAAAVILEQAAKHLELAELAARLDRLKEAVDAANR